MDDIAQELTITVPTPGTFTSLGLLSHGYLKAVKIYLTKCFMLAPLVQMLSCISRFIMCCSLPRGYPTLVLMTTLTAARIPAQPPGPAAWRAQTRHTSPAPNLEYASIQIFCAMVMSSVSLARMNLLLLVWIFGFATKSSLLLQFWNVLAENILVLCLSM